LVNSVELPLERRSDDALSGRSLPPFPIGWALAGGIIGVGAYIMYALLFEEFILPALREPGAPQLSIGQQFGFALLMIGVLVVASLSGAIPITFISGMLWQSSTIHNGRDPSDWIIFAPMFFGAIALALLPIGLRAFAKQ
jgi:hypothetical protein